MKRSTLFLILCGAFVLIAGTAYAAIAQTSFTTLLHRNTVVFDGSQFYPEKLTVSLGTRVTFVNKSNEAFWPASNLHPSHSIYSAFDPQKPIPTGDTWSFTFTRSGIWGYHDHMKPIVTGTISVLSAEGKEGTTTDCTAGENAACWQQEVTTALETGGIDEAFDVLSKHLEDNDPKFQEVCHDLTHSIGQKAYRLFVGKESVALSDKVAYCGYGFFHGFMEALLETSGDINEAHDFCAYVGTALAKSNPHAVDACYHGIGHGVVDGSDHRAWGNPDALIAPGLELCLKVAPDSNELQQCGNGVFNALAVAYINGDYGLSVTDPKEAYSICARQRVLEIKTGCYEQMNPIAALYGKDDPVKTLSLMNTIPQEADREIAVRTLAGTFMHQGMDDAAYASLISACNTLGSDLSMWCIRGLVTKLIEFGPLGHQYDIGLSFCALPSITAAERDGCYASTVTMTDYLYTKDTQEKVCAMIEKLVPIVTVDSCRVTKQTN